MNGYLGYVEPADRVTRGVGESDRQLFGPELLESLRFGTEATRAALRPSRDASTAMRAMNVSVGRRKTVHPKTGNEVSDSASESRPGGGG